MLRTRWTWLAVLGFVVSGTTFLASCSAAQEALGITSSALTTGSVVDMATVGGEMSGDWTPDSGGLDILTWGFNGNQWVWSSNQGATWTWCNSALNNGVDASCNGTFGAFAIPDSGTLNGFFLAGDPTVVADKMGNVVYVSLADNNSGCGNGTKGVVAVLSTDGGRTYNWNTMVLVNDTACSNGCQDQPDATFDFSTSPPSLIVAFRHDGVTPGTFGACTRRYFIDGTSHLVPMNDAQSVSNMATSVPSYGIGALKVRAGGGVTTLVYTTTDSPGRCPNTGTSVESVASSVSYDYGVSWTYGAVFGYSGTWPGSGTYSSCVLSQQVDISANPRNFDYVRAPDGSNYVVYQDTKSTMRLFMDRSQSSFTNGAGGYDHWREWCPGTATADGGPTTNWIDTGGAGTTAPCATPFYSQGQASPDAGSGNSLAMPSIAVDDQGRLAVWFYEGDSTDSMFHIHFRGNVSPRSPTSAWVDTDLSSNFTPGVGGPGSAGAFRALGDYQGLAVRNALHQPTCGNTGTFFPGWTFANTDAGIDSAATSNPESIDGGVSFP
jgi:hypothetical protein